MLFCTTISWKTRFCALTAIGSLACGGLAVIDPDDGSGGSSATTAPGPPQTTTATSSSTTDTATSTSTGMFTVTATSSTTGGGSVCEDGCDRLFDCTQEGNLCPGLQGASAEAEKEFKLNCVNNPLCEASANILEGKDCPDMIAALKDLSFDFKTTCEGPASP